jgi:uncharacterized membrane protein
MVTSSLLAFSRLSACRLFHHRYQRRKDHPSLLIRIIVWAVILAAGHRAHAQQAIQTLDQHLRPAITSGQAAVVGALPGDRQINFSLVLPLQNEGDLTALLNRLYDPSSQDYRHFLSVDEFTQRFSPTQASYEAVVSFAKANGFTVTGTPANRLVVPVRASVDQINKAFHLTMTEYRHPVEDRTFYSPDRNPSFQLATPIAHIAGLDDYSIPKSMLKRAKQDGKKELNEALKAASVSGSGPYQSYLASDMRAAYYGGTTLDGNGQVVGILEFGGYLKSDVDETFSSAGQSYTVPLNNVLLDGAIAEPEEGYVDGEQVLDIVQAIGMAPGLAQVRVYIGKGNDDANILASMASENIAKSISCSWSWIPADPTTDDVFFKEFAAQGQSFFVASGDDGAYDTALDPYVYPAEDAYVTAVGGTHLSASSPGGSWASEVAWNTPYVGSGGGISPDGIAIPNWQAGLATFANGGSATLRNVPDVAMEADVDNYSCELGYCYSEDGGTSFAAPRWAAFMALVNQQAVEAGGAPAGGIGFLNPNLYAIAKGTGYSEALHDITQGNNDTYGQPVYYFAVPGYDLVTGWGSPSGQSLIDDLAGPQKPGFWIEPSATNVLLFPGKSATTTITVTDAVGFSGNVTLAITSALPAGITATWSKNPTGSTSVLTFQAAATAPVGAVTVAITGTSGKLTFSTKLVLQVQQPTFTLASIPNALLLNPGNTVTSTITLNSEYGFTGSATLSASGLPAGVTATFSPATISGAAGTSTMTLKATASAVQAETAFTLVGTSGALKVNQQIPLNIAAPAIGFFSIGSVSMGRSSSTSVYVSPYGENGFTGNIQLSISGLPSGVTASFSTNPVSSLSSQTLLTLISTGTVAYGNSTVTIKGTSGSVSGTTTFTLGVDPPSFFLSAPISASLGQGTTATYPFYVFEEYGFTGNVSLTASGLPKGVTASFSPNPANGFVELALTAASATPVGASTITVTGTSGQLTKTTTFPLGIFVPTFTISSQTAVTMGQTDGAIIPVTVNPEYGFSGSVNLSVSGLPKGVSAAISPNPASKQASLVLTSNGTAVPGITSVKITGVSGSQTSATTLQLTINAPGFSVSSPGPLVLGQGTTLTSSIPITESNGFSGLVNLSVAGLPSGVSASFSPNPTNGNTSLTLTATGTASIGTSSVAITGTSGKLASTTKFTLSVSAANLTITAPASLSMGPGTTTSSPIALASTNGFNAPVTLAVSGLPSGVTATISPNPSSPATTPYNEAILTLSASNSVALGTTVVTITGTSGKLTSKTTFSLIVGAPSFSIPAQPTTTVGIGTTSTTYISVSSLFGFSGNVTLSVSGLPKGVSASISPNPLSFGPGQAQANTMLTLTASSAAAAGQASLTLTGTSGKTTASATFPIAIYAPAFTLSMPYYGFTLGQGSTATTQVDINPLYGFNGSVNLSVSGLPSGVSATFSPNPTTGYSVLTLAATSAASVGSAIVTVTGTSGKTSATTTFPLTIGTPTFTLAAPQSVTIGQGSSTTAYININPQYGFAGAVNLVASGLPSGVTASFSPNPSTGETLLTLNASATSPLGAHTVTITAIGGKVTQATTFSLVTSAPSFTLSGVTSIMLTPSNSITTQLYVTSINGFGSSVNFAISGLPAGVTASFLPNTSNYETTLTLTASSTAPLGYSPVTITGTYGNQKQSTIILLGIVAPSFTLNGPSSINLGQSISTTANIQINPQTPLPGNVKLSVSNLPAGVTASFSPSLAIGSSQLTLTSSSTAVIGTSTLIITGAATGTNATATATIPLTVSAPTFTIQAYGNGALGQGSTTPINVSIQPANGFTGEVNLAVSGLPAGVTASILSNPITTNSIITLTASSTAPVGTYSLMITGTSGKLTQSSIVPISVVAPTFSFYDCSEADLLPGSSYSCYVSIQPSNGFEGSVNFAVTGLPSGVTGSFSPNPSVSQSILTLTAASTAPVATKTGAITGTSGKQSSSVPLVVSVIGPSFSLYSSAPALTLGQGSSAVESIYVNGSNGFNSNASFSISGLPAGVSAAFSPNPVTATGSTALTLNVAATAAVGTSNLTVTATAGTQKVTLPIVLTVVQPSFTISTFELLSVGVGSNSTSNYINLSSNSNFTGNVQLAISGLPAGVSASFSPNPAAVGNNSNLTLAATAAAIPGTYPVTISGVSGTVKSSTTTTLTVSSPSFALDIFSGASLGQGTSTTNTMFIEGQNNFAGNVKLSVTGLPSGVTVSFSPNPVTSSGYYNVVITTTASSTAVSGQYMANVTGTSGNLTASSQFPVVVSPPTFTVQAGYGGTPLVAGSSTTIPVYITPQNGFTGSVTLVASGLPSGVTATFSPNPTVNGNSTLTLVASSTAPVGDYSFTVTGRSGNTTASTTTVVDVVAPGFTINGPYGNLSLGRGASATSYIYLQPIYGSGSIGSASLSVSGLPAGVTASFSPNPTTTGSSTMTVSASSSASLGQYNVKVVATTGKQSASTTFPITIYAPTFTVQGPGSVAIGQGTTTTASAGIYQQYGFTGNVSFSISNLPTGVTGSFSPNPTTQSTTLTLVASKTAPLGQYNALITATSGNQTSSTYFPISIYTPTFTLNGPYGVTVSQGTVSTTQATINPQYGFNSNVSFSISGLPKGLTASISPNPATQTTVVSLAASSTAATGTYNLTLTGTSGSQKSSTTFQVTINAATFTLSAYSVNLGVGASTTSFVSYLSGNGFAGAVNLTVSGLPSGVTASISPNPISPYGVIQLTASKSAALGNYTFKVTGTSGSLTSSIMVGLTLVTPTFTINGPYAIQMGQGTTSSTYVLNVQPQYGFSGNVTFAVSGLPKGVTASFSPNPTATQETALTLTAGSTVPVGTYSLTITGTSGSQSATTTFPLSIFVPTFSPSVFNYNVAPGSNSTQEVYVEPEYGFNKEVTFTVSGLPNGVTAYFSPNPTLLNSALKLVASSSVKAGNYTFRLTGTSGSLSLSTNVDLTISVPTSAAERQ